MDTIISELKYNNNYVVVVKDKNNHIWFNAINVCKILGYKNNRDVIISLVNKNHRNKLKNIFEDYKLYPKAHPDTIYLNESGLYTLLIRSKKPKAEKFFLWVVEDVLPSIRKSGVYTTNKKYLKQIQDLNKIIDEKTLQIKALENNQKNKHICTKGRYIYVLKSSLDDYIDKDKPDILKIGKTRKYKIRMATYNTSVKDDVIVLYRAKVNDISAVENCLKGLLSKKVYRSYKEYYEVTLDEAIKTIKKCIKLTGSTLMSEDKFYLDFKISRSTPLNGFTININDCSGQNGGSNDYDFNTYKSTLKMFVTYNYVLNMAKEKELDNNPINKLFNKWFIV
jgi:prophage antirepressor-like protein